MRGRPIHGSYHHRGPFIFVSLLNYWTVIAILRSYRNYSSSDSEAVLARNSTVNKLDTMSKERQLWMITLNPEL